MVFKDSTEGLPVWRAMKCWLLRRVLPHCSGSLHNSFTLILSSGPIWSVVYISPSALQGKQLMSQHHLLLLQFLPQGVRWSKQGVWLTISLPQLLNTPLHLFYRPLPQPYQFSLASPFIKRCFLEVVFLAAFLPPLPLRNLAQSAREPLPSCRPLQKPPPVL